MIVEVSLRVRVALVRVLGSVATGLPEVAHDCEVLENLQGLNDALEGTAVSWGVDIKLSSDHLPICISLVDDQPNPGLSRSFTNFCQADWTGYRNEVERLISQLPAPSSCASGEKAFRVAIQTAAKHNIPAGYVKDHCPGLHPEVLVLVNRYDALRERNPNNPGLGKLASKINSARNGSSRKRWREFVESLGCRQNPKCYWQVLHNLAGKEPMSLQGPCLY